MLLRVLIKMQYISVNVIDNWWNLRWLCFDIVSNFRPHLQKFLVISKSFLQNIDVSKIGLTCTCNESLMADSSEYRTSGRYFMILAIRQHIYNGFIVLNFDFFAVVPVVTWYRSLGVRRKISPEVKFHGNPSWDILRLRISNAK